MSRDLSIIIVNYNGWKHLAPCLRAVRATVSAETETIVVDNGSIDETCTALPVEFPGVRLIAEKQNSGFGAANMLGAAQSSRKYVVFLNNDTVVQPGWIEALCAPLESDPQIGASCSTLLLADSPRLLNARGGGMSRLGYGYDIGFATLYFGEKREKWQDVFFPTGACMAMRRHDLLQVGGFDPAMFMYHEDLDLGWRLWLSGKRVVVCVGSIVHHHCGSTVRSTRSARWKESLSLRHTIRTMLKNYEWSTAQRTIAALVLAYWKAGEIALLSRALAWNLFQLLGTLSLRRAVQRKRTLPDTEFFRRGLIDTADFAPSTSPRVMPPAELAEELFVSRNLEVAFPSAESRLQHGWHEPEPVASERWRWTNGDAACVLKVTPHEQGTLKVEARLVSGRVSSRTLTVECNGAKREADLGDAREIIELPAIADAAGMLHIALRSATWRPCDEGVNGSDSRTLGTMIRRLEFVPLAGGPSYRPRNATVIIPTCNRREILEICLEHLSKQTCHEFDVIVVDDGSFDGTRDFLSRALAENRFPFHLQALHQENAGPGAARNLALRHTSGDVVIFIGDDILPEPAFVHSHLEKHRMAGEPCAVVGYTHWDSSRMFVSPFLRFVNEAGYQFMYGSMQPGSETTFGAFYTSNLSITRSLLGTDPFHAAFRRANWEDTELGYRLAQRGLRLFYEPLARARHLHPQNMLHFLLRQWQVGHSSSVFFGLHPELRRNPSVTLHDSLPRFPYDVLTSPLMRLLWNALDAHQIALPERLYRLLVERAVVEGLRASAE